MAARNGRTAEQVRQDIELQRNQLAHAVDDLRGEIEDATNIGGKLRGKLPLVAAGALGAGFIVAGGIGATMRLFMRKSREGTTKAKLGRFAFIDRD